MKPRTSALDRRTAMRLAATEYQRCAELLRSLDAHAWAVPTACPAWDVRQMAAHMLGMVEMAASIREGSRQRRAATVNGNIDIDRLTALQVSERTSWPGPAISDRFAARAPKAVTGRRMTPGFIRRRTMTGGVINGVEEPWTLGYLIDVILTWSATPATTRTPSPRRVSLTPSGTPNYAPPRWTRHCLAPAPSAKR